jgi:hypothetical protein
LDGTSVEIARFEIFLFFIRVHLCESVVPNSASLHSSDGVACRKCEKVKAFVAGRRIYEADGKSLSNLGDKWK